MQLPLYQIDAFTSRLFAGNPAAVVPLDAWLPDEVMQAIAIENALAETAFFVRNARGHYEIRWFSPFTEIDFCGHATLASAFVLFNQLGAPETLTFWAKAVGDIPVRRLPDGKLELSFPELAPTPLSEVPAALVEGLSIAPSEYWISRQAYFAVYDNAAQVEAVVTRSDLLKTLAPRDVVVTAPGVAHDFHSRYFWPANGGEEDSVTGSIHAGLAPFWAKRLGKSHLQALQGLQRQGELDCRVADSRVFVAGHAVQYLQGVITVRAGQ